MTGQKIVVGEFFPPHPGSGVGRRVGGVVWCGTELMMVVVVDSGLCPV
jgi:hypothetical protein